MTVCTACICAETDDPVIIPASPTAGGVCKMRLQGGDRGNLRKAICRVPGTQDLIATDIEYACPGQTDLAIG